VGGGELVLRCVPILDRDDDRVGLAGERLGGSLVGIEVGDDPAAAVIIDDDGEALLPLAFLGFGSGT
jgi:hypothetical protein